MTPRRLALIGLVAGALAAAVGYLAAGAVGLAAAAVLIQLGIFLTVVVTWRDLRLLAGRPSSDGPKLRKQLSTSLQQHGEANAQLQREVIRQLEVAQSAATDRLLEAVGESRDGLAAELRRERQRTVDLLTGVADRQFRQLEALAGLYYGIQPSASLPATRSWAASPDLLRYLYEYVCRERPKTIVECGSGVTTLVMAYALREIGGGKVVALEHLERYHQVSTTLLREHGLEDHADVRLAPLEDVELSGETWPWYRLSEVPDGPIDLLLVDGPPGAVRHDARFPALPLLYDRLADDAMIVLDDHDREDEREVVERWQSQFPSGVSTEILKHEKGTAVLRRVPTQHEERLVERREPTDGPGPSVDR